MSLPGFRSCRGLLLAGLLLAGTAGCFDYRERVVFRRDLSGFLEIEYTVPVHPVSTRSAVAFLPIEREAIQDRYSSLFFLDRVELENYRVSYSMGSSRMFPLLAHVRYRLQFQRPVDLERLLLGRASVNHRRRQVVIRRSFPTTRPLHEDSGRLARRIHEITREQIEGRSMEFVVEVPPGFELGANLGRPQNGSWIFQLPLESTLQNTQDFSWRVSLTAPPP